MRRVSRPEPAGDEPSPTAPPAARLTTMLEQLRANGCDVDEKVDESDYGKFGWVMDPEGNRIELWEPPLRTPAS